MSHYYDSNPQIESKIREISFEVNGLQMKLKTDNGVFSKNRVDEGSLTLLKVILPLKLTGEILDLGCGYGTIGLTIAMSSPTARLTLADINSRALILCERNAKELGLSQRVTCLQSDIFENIEGRYDSLVLNPPIRAGKKVTYAMYEQSRDYLIDGGSLFIVIRKAQGALSAADFIKNVFGNCTLLKRHKGYYVYQAVKQLSK